MLETGTSSTTASSSRENSRDVVSLASPLEKALELLRGLLDNKKGGVPSKTRMALESVIEHLLEIVASPTKPHGQQVDIYSELSRQLDGGARLLPATACDASTCARVPTRSPSASPPACQSS